MNTKGNLLKMHTSIVNDEVQYHLPVGAELIPMNDLIGQEIRFDFEGEINCIECGNNTAKSFAQGFCFPCFRDSPRNSPCIIRPELCEAHLGQGRDVEWEEKFHNQPHIVYLALSSAVKVGVTRHNQIPTRFIDQGASQVIILAEVPYRALAGEIEVALKEYVTDRTNWQRMLKNMIKEDVDLLDEKERLCDYVPDELQELISDNDEVLTLNYPVTEYPTKIKSQSFDKTSEVSGKLIGIKGQYLIFDEGRVLNIRKHAGYLVSFLF